MTDSSETHTDIATLIWQSRYRYMDDSSHGEATVEDTWRRVAHALASVEPADTTAWEERFFDQLNNYRFLPGGRILAGAGTAHEVTLFNCFVMGPVADSMDGIFDALKEGAITMQQGGGVGYDFSTLRPAGCAAQRVGTVASGPVSFMQIWDSMCATLLATAPRRGAMMATLRCDHPDIEAFIEAKRDADALHNFNLSVLVTDDFIQAVKADEDWPLVFPLSALGGQPPGAEIIEHNWTGHDEAQPCVVFRHVRARELWQRMLRAAYDCAEPGVLFIDRINALNNLQYRETISATNPCGEIPLPAYGACDLGSINLSRYVLNPFTADATIDWQGLEQSTAVAVRMLDNVIDLSGFPFPAQAEQARGSRRIGLGITGLADCLILCGLHYGSEEGRQLAAAIVRSICHGAYRASLQLAQEKGPFPFLEREAYLASPFVRALPKDIRSGIAEHGIRNSHLIAIAPAGTISLFAGNVSSGIEPVFKREYKRRIRGSDDSVDWYTIRDHAWRLWQQQHPDGEPPASIINTFVDAHSLRPEDHLAMQAALQPYVDSAISKTINVPQGLPFEAFQELYMDAYALGLKGCTAFRPNPLRHGVLASDSDGATPEAQTAHCCSVEREGD